ncbi:MAG: hypothetical protein GY754_23025 [bacterium]|nr:hypothetical protein [bacterium]
MGTRIIIFIIIILPVLMSMTMEEFMNRKEEKKPAKKNTEKCVCQPGSNRTQEFSFCFANGEGVLHHEYLVKTKKKGVQYFARKVGFFEHVPNERCDLGGRGETKKCDIRFLIRDTNNKIYYIQVNKTRPIEGSDSIREIFYTKIELDPCTGRLNSAEPRLPSGAEVREVYRNQFGPDNIYEEWEDKKEFHKGKFRIFNPQVIGAMASNCYTYEFINSFDHYYSQQGKAHRNNKLYDNLGLGKNSIKPYRGKNDRIPARGERKFYYKGASAPLSNPTPQPK